jgi:hypothetical protein
MSNAHPPAAGWFIATQYQGRARSFRADLVVALERQESYTQIVLSKAGGQLHIVFADETVEALQARIGQALLGMAACGLAGGPLIDNVLSSFEAAAVAAARKIVETEAPAIVDRHLALMVERDDAAGEAPKRKGGK